MDDRELSGKLVDRLIEATGRLAPLQPETSLRQAIVDSAAAVFESPAVGLFLVDGAGLRLAATAGRFAPDDRDGAVEIDLDRGATAVGTLAIQPGDVDVTSPPGAFASRLLAAQAVAALDNARRHHEVELATLAHEVRNPLATIATALHVLDRFGPADPQTVRMRELIGRQTRHLARLVEDILDVDRLRHRKLRLERQRVDLREAVRQAIDAIRATARADDRELHAMLPDVPVVVEGDATRLEQVVRNLLDNAIKYTRAGGTIDVVVGRERGEGVLRVRDDGIGIDAGMLPRLFDRFAQADAAAPRAAGGLGLGLPLVSAIVEEHGGTITVHSDGAGQGSEFVVRLPAR